MGNKASNHYEMTNIRPDYRGYIFGDSKNRIGCQFVDLYFRDTYLFLHFSAHNNKSIKYTQICEWHSGGQYWSLVYRGRDGQRKIVVKFADPVARDISMTLKGYITDMIDTDYYSSGRQEVVMIS